MALVDCIKSILWDINSSINPAHSDRDEEGNVLNHRHLNSKRLLAVFLGALWVSILVCTILLDKGYLTKNLSEKTIKDLTHTGVVAALISIMPFAFYCLVLAARRCRSLPCCNDGDPDWDPYTMTQRK